MARIRPSPKETVLGSVIRCSQTAIGNCNWKLQLEPGPARAIFTSMAGHVVIRITERLGGGEPLRTAYAVAEPNQHRAIALFKLDRITPPMSRLRQ